MTRKPETNAIRDQIERTQFMEHITMLSLSSNLGDSRTIVTHPASTTHSKLSAEERGKVGISDGMIRLSVGLEHPDDILQDIYQALDAVS